MPFSRPSSERGARPISSKRAAHPECLGPESLDKIAYFETLRAYGGKIFCLDRHLERLEESCRAALDALPIGKSELGRRLTRSLAESGLAEAVLRVSVSWEDEKKGSAIVMVREFKPRDPELYRKGIELRTAVMRRWGFRAQDPKIKASQFMNGVLAFLDKGDAPADELLFLGQNGVVAEGSISNIFIVREKRLLTPDTASGILRGVTRGLVTELAQKRKIPFVETLLTRHEIYNANFFVKHQN
ncbi:MAG: aminotransferase class IV [Candidatus Omnitrophica bacterium]|nr:aminotransferase class IV [Candidatus Omnitrophota bacterium]